MNPRRVRSSVVGPLASRFGLLALLALTVVAPDMARARSLYVVNTTTNNVSVIETGTGSVAETVAVGTTPVGVAINPTGSRAYVANYISNTVSVIDTSSNSVTETISVGTRPIGVAVGPDGARAYVANSTASSVSVIDTVTNSVVATVPVGSAPAGVAVTPDGGAAYVTNFGGSSVSVIDTATNVVTNTIAVGAGPRGISFSPDGNIAYAVNQTSGTVSAIDVATATVTATATVGSSPRLIAIAPDGGRVYVANNDSNDVSVIDGATNSVVATITVGTNPRGAAIAPGGDRLYVTNTGGNSVSVVDTASNTVTDTITLSPTGTGALAGAIVPNQGPTASFTVNAASAGSASTFDATGSSDVDGSVATGAWDFGDGSTGTGLTTSHIYQSAGSYTATFTATDNEGCSTSRVFTGLTVLCNGSTLARASGTVAVASAPPSADTRAPTTTIESGPAQHTRMVSATFVFSADESQVAFQCRLDNEDWGACGSPEVVYAIGLGAHRFEVRAQDRAGNVGAADGWDWTVDRRAPKLKRTNIKGNARIRRKSLRKIYGLAGSDVAATGGVKVKLQILGKGGKLDPGQCAYLSLKTGHRIVHRCNRAFTAVEGDRRWELPLVARVRDSLRTADRYRLLIRTRDLAGNKRTYRVSFRVV